MKPSDFRKARMENVIEALSYKANSYMAAWYYAQLDAKYYEDIDSKPFGEASYSLEDSDYAEMLHMAERCAYHLWQASILTQEIYDRDFLQWVEVMDSEFDPDDECKLQPAYLFLTKHLPKDLLNFIDGE